MRITPNLILRDMKRHQKFRAVWQGKRHVKASIMPAEQMCKINDIVLYKPQDLFTTHTHYHLLGEEANFKFVPQQEIVATKEYHLIRNKSSTLLGWGLASMQNLTNTYVFDSLPKYLTEVESESSEDEVGFVKGTIEYAQLLNTSQTRIPALKDPNCTYMVTIKKLAVPRTQRMKSTSKQLLGLLDHLYPVEGRRMEWDVSCKNKYNFNGSDVFMDLTSFVHVTAKKPLTPVLSVEEVTALSGEPLPDIYPLSPLASFPQKELKSDTNTKLPGNSFPHTLFIHQLVIEADFCQDKYASLALLNAYNTVVTYARRNNENHDCDLSHPITVNVVLHNGRHFQLAVFQLNTLSMSGPTKNIFWYEPMQMLFSNVVLDEGKACVQDYNTHPYQILKQMYKSQ